jgi:hypothetical protein
MVFRIGGQPGRLVADVRIEKTFNPVGRAGFRTGRAITARMA